VSGRLRGARVVLRKELRDNLRDRRSLTSSLVMPLLGPLLFALALTAVARLGGADRPLLVTVRGGERAPSLVAWLERHGALVEAAPEDAEARVRDGKLDLLLAIPDGYAAEFRAGRPAPVELFVDSSRNSARAPVRRVERLLAAFSAELGALRLLARGVSPQLAAPLRVEEVDLASSAAVAASLLGMVPLLLLLTVFVGGMYLAIDAAAGERERGSLEPLLICPVGRGQLVLGKWAATVLMSWLALTCSLAGFALALRLVPLQDLGVRAQLGLRQLLGMAAVLLPLSLLAAGLQMVLAIFARTFKEAQTYLSLMMLVPTLPASFLALSPLQPKTWMMLVPALGQTLLLGDLMRGEALHPLWHLLAGLSALCCAGLSLAAAVRLIGREEIVFGRGAGG
jgi:sodium transport system permease protein